MSTETITILTPENAESTDLFCPSTYDPAADGAIVTGAIKPSLRIALAYAVDVYYTINGNGAKGKRADSATDAPFDAPKVKYQAGALRDADSKGGVRWTDLHNDIRCPMAVWGFIDAGRVTFTETGLIATVDMTGVETRRDFRDIATAKGTLRLVASGGGRKSDDKGANDSQAGNDTAPPTMKSEDGATVVPVDADKVARLESALDLASKEARLAKMEADKVARDLSARLEHAARALGEIAVMFGLPADATPGEVSRAVRAVVDAAGKGKNKGRGTVDTVTG